MYWTTNINITTIYKIFLYWDTSSTGFNKNKGVGSIFLFSENDDNKGIIWQAGKNECKVIPSLGESVSGHLRIIKLMECFILGFTHPIILVCSKSC